MKQAIKKFPFIRSLVRRLDNLNARTDWVRMQLSKLPKGAKLLDAGCGSQQFKKFCDHLDYKGQDFGQYVADEKGMIGGHKSDLGSNKKYEYGKLD